MHLSRWFLSLSSATAVLSAAAQTAPTAPPGGREERVYLEQLVVTASPLTRTQANLVQTTSVLADTALATQSKGTIGATLTGEVGITATDFGPGASRPVIRGVGGDRIRVLENGLGTLDVSNISPDHGIGVEPLLLDRVEVVRGPATLRYGSAAIGGVVNTIDGRIPANPPDRPLTGRFEARASTADNERAAALRLTGGGGPLAWTAAGFRRATGDVHIPGNNLHVHTGEELDEHQAENLVSGRIPNTAAESDGASAGATWFWKSGRIGAAFTAYNTLFGVPPGAHVHHEEHGGGEEEPEPEEPEWVQSDLHQRRFDVRAAITESFGPFTGATLDLGFADYDHTELEGGAVGTRFDQTGRDARLELAHQPLGELTGSIGFQYQFTDLAAAGAEAYLPPVRTTSRAAYLFEELTAGPLVWQAGARYEHQRVAPEATSGHLPRSFDGASASLGAVWTITKEWGLAVSAGHSERLPTATELYADGPHPATQSYELGDATLAAEHAHSFEVSLRRRAGLVTGAVNLFTNRFDGYIFEEATGAEADGLPVYRFVARDAKFTGIEVETLWHLHQSERHSFDLKLATDRVRATDRTTRDPLPRIPPQRFIAGLRYSGQNLSLGFDVTRAGRQGRVAPDEEETDGYTLVGAEASWRHSWSGREFTVFLRGTNLLDEEARNHVSFLKEIAPLPGRNVTLGLSLSF